MPKLLESRFVTGPRDELASVDVYEVTENTIRSRASMLPDETVNQLMEMLRVPLSQADGLIGDAVGLIDSLLGGLEGRAADLLDSISPGLSSVLDVIPMFLPGGALASEGGASGLGDDMDTAEMASLALELAYQYGGDYVTIPPEYRLGATSVIEVVGELQRQRKSGDATITDSKIADRGAETLVLTAVTGELVKLGLVPPIVDTLAVAADDVVRKNVALSAVAVALNPTNQPVPNEDEILNGHEGPLHHPLLDIAAEFATNALTRDESVTPVAVDEETSSVPTPKVGNGSVIGKTEEERKSWGVDTTGKYSSLFAEPTNAPQPSLQQKASKTLAQTPGVRNNAPTPAPLEEGEEKAKVNLDVLETLLNYTSPAEVLARYPNVIRDILWGYRLPRTDDRDLATEYTRVVTLMDTINPDWFKGNRGGVETALNPFNRASLDAIFLFTAAPNSDYVAEALVGKSYRFNDIPRLIRAQYPHAAI